MGKIVLEGGQGISQAGRVKQWLCMVKKVYVFIYLFIYLFIYIFIYLNSITPSYKTNLHGASIKHDTLKWQNVIKKISAVSQT